MPKRWIFDPCTANSKISASEKVWLQQRCNQFIDAELKPKNIKPFNPNNKKEAQLIDIYCKWHRNNILFIAKYKDLRPNVISLEYEIKFARISCLNKNQYYLHYLRHTGEWWDITCQAGNSFKQCLQDIKELPYFTF